MAHCPYCSSSIEPDSRFCPHCGKPMPNPNKKRSKLLPILGIIAALAAVVIGLLALASKPFSENTRAIAQASSSVVTLYVYNKQEILRCTGSGFAAIEEGLIVTNFHVIEEDCYTVEAVTEDGTTLYIDSVVCYDKDKDIAILRSLQSKLTPLSTAGGLNLDRGEVLTAIGSPIGFNNMVSTGVLSNYLLLSTHTRLLFTTSISPGSSGGALFDDDGNVVGITSGLYPDGNNIYYAIPFTYVEELYNSRDLTDERSPAQLWKQSAHPYSVAEVLSVANSLNGKTIEVTGYVSACMQDIYLVDSPSQVLRKDKTDKLSLEEAFDLMMLLDQQKLDGIALHCQKQNHKAFDDNLAGQLVTLKGNVVIYTDGTGKDIRFNVSEVISSQ